MKNIIVSAVNLTEGGTLTILRECLNFLSDDLSEKYEIIALVNKKDCCFFENIKYLEFPKSKKKWINRVYYEYYYFRKLSKRLNPFLWLSLHDITPNVTTDRLAVYCHNPSPFYKLSFKEAMLDPKFALFNALYKHLYGINIKKNNFVIVQQDWFRQELAKFYEKDKIIVSYPKTHKARLLEEKNKNFNKRSDFTFFYPAFPRVFKNFEIICEAAKISARKNNNNFKIYITIDGKENRYSKHIVDKYGKLEKIHFVGRLSRNEVESYYNKADCLIFPSKLETWGLPLSEFKNYGKPILAADRKYARETVGEYDKVKFFNLNNADYLSNCMNEVMENRIIFDITERKKVKSPFASDWKELFDILLDEEKGSYVRHNGVSSNLQK